MMFSLSVYVDELRSKKFICEPKEYSTCFYTNYSNENLFSLNYFYGKNFWRVKQII